jgi:hypothetical protein
MSIPSIVELAGVFENPEGALRYLVLHGVLQVPEICSREACLGRMRVSNLLKLYFFIDGALMEFIWRRRYADTLWNRLLHAMQHVIYDADAEKCRE